jgi:predicted glycosyltransferase involved in capsule biosynthesis
MLSICIPVYNFDVRQLVKDLHQQATSADIPFEILLVDDFSDITFRSVNGELSELDNVVYDELPENIGRSRIRNYMAEKAEFNSIIFLDCDVEIFSRNFVENYIKQIETNSIVCGGHVYSETKPLPYELLHWLYGSTRESKEYAIRQQSPYNSFMTGNFLISKNLFSKFSFNETLVGYGHEDTLFGFELMINKIQVNHINNPVIHLGLDDNHTFMEKNRQGIKNLIRIYRSLLGDKDFVKMIRLLKSYNNVRLLKLTWLVSWVFDLTENVLENNLLGSSPRLILLDFYKLGYFCKCIHSKDLISLP